MSVTFVGGCRYFNPGEELPDGLIHNHSVIKMLPDIQVSNNTARNFLAKVGIYTLHSSEYTHTLGGWINKNVLESIRNVIPTNNEETALVKLANTAIGLRWY